MNDYIPSEAETQDTLPRALEAEQGVLGCIMLDPAVLEKAEARISSANAFDDPRNRLLWQTFRRMKNNGGIDLVTVCDYLRKEGTLAEVGMEYIAGLTDSVPSILNLSYYLDIVVEKHDMRQMIRTCSDVIGRVRNSPGQVESLVSYLNTCVRRLTPQRHTLPDIMDACALASRLLPEPPELIEGMLHRGSQMSLGGGSKTCKTWVLMDLALSVSHGVSWLGIPTTKAKVLYINMEVEEWSFRKRLVKIAREKEMEIEEGVLDTWTLRNHVVSYTQLFPQIRQKLETRNYSLIVLDPIYKLYGDLNENDARDMTKLLNEVGRLTRESGAASAFAAHFSKGNQSQKEAIDRVSGSGVYGRHPDTVAVMTAHNMEECFVIEAKLRDLAPLKPFVVEWKYPLMRRRDDLDSTDLKKTGGRKKTYDESKILALLDKPMTPAQWCKKASEELGTTRSSFYRAAADLESANMVFKSTEGKYCPIKSKDMDGTAP